MTLMSGGRFAEFFAGIGLMRMGLERAGWECVFANDIDPGKLEMYSGHYRDADQHFRLSDIRQISPRDVPSIDLATASFPCTDLSLAGARRGLGGEHSSAFWPFVELLHKLESSRPRVVLLENVVGFLSSGQGSDLKNALCALNSLGYTVDVLVLDAALFVPQSRQRLFVIGVYDPRYLSIVERRSQYNLFGFEFDEGPSVLRPEAVVSFIAQNQDLRWNIRPLVKPRRADSGLESILEDLPEDACEWWSEERVAYLLGQMSDRHRALADLMIANPWHSFGTVFRRIRNGRSMAELRSDGIAGCLRTPKGGSGRQILFRGGKDQARARLLTPRECARLMGADDYTITVPVNQALFGFGDAVCVPVIEWIANNYLNPVLAESPSLESVQA